MHPFRMLDDWAQEDKHRQLPVAAGWSRHMNFHSLEDYENFTPTRQEMSLDPLPLAPGTDLVRVIGRRNDPTKEPGVKLLWQGSMSIRSTDGVLIDEAPGHLRVHHPTPDGRARGGAVGGPRLASQTPALAWAFVGRHCRPSSRPGGGRLVCARCSSGRLIPRR